MRNSLTDRYAHRFQPRTSSLSSAFIRQVEHQSRHSQIAVSEPSSTPQGCGELIASSELPDMSIYAQRSQIAPSQRVATPETNLNKPVSLKTLKSKNEVGLILKHAAPVVGHGSNSAGVAKISPRQQRLISQATQLGDRPSGGRQHIPSPLTQAPSRAETSENSIGMEFSPKTNPQGPGESIRSANANSLSNGGPESFRSLVGVKHKMDTGDKELLAAASTPKDSESNLEVSQVPDTAKTTDSNPTAVDGNLEEQHNTAVQPEVTEIQQTGSPPDGKQELTLQQRLAFIRQRKAEQAAMRKMVLD